MYAGGKIGSNNSPFYLVKGGMNCTTLSPAYYDNSSNMDTIINVFSSGAIGYDFVMAASLRPAIQLKSDVQISKGNGNVENPYVISTN